MLASKCVSYYNGVYFFDILTSKNCPTLRCFIYFDLEICYGVYFSENGMFYIFCFGNVFRAITAYIFFDILFSKSGPEVFCTF